MLRYKGLNSGQYGLQKPGLARFFLKLFITFNEMRIFQKMHRASQSPYRAVVAAMLLLCTIHLQFIHTF